MTNSVWRYAATWPINYTHSEYLLQEIQIYYSAFCCIHCCLCVHCALDVPLSVLINKVVWQRVRDKWQNVEMFLNSENVDVYRAGKRRLKSIFALASHFFKHLHCHNCWKYVNMQSFLEKTISRKSEMFQTSNYPEKWAWMMRFTTTTNGASVSRAGFG